MDVSGTARLSLHRRVWAAWLLFLFAFTQGVPVFALAITDGMSGMACCKRGADSCCRRKQMHKPPSVEHGRHCGPACCGTPMLSARMSAASPAVPGVAFGPAIRAERLVPAELPAPVTLRTPLLRFQKPPPFLA